MMAKIILCLFVISILGCNNSFHSLPSEGDHNNLPENLSVVHTFDRLILSQSNAGGDTSWVHESGEIVDSHLNTGVTPPPIGFISISVVGDEAREIKEIFLQDSLGKKIETGICSGGSDFYSCNLKVTGYEKFECPIGPTIWKPRGGSFDVIALLSNGEKKSSNINFPDPCVTYKENPLYVGGQRKVASVSAITHQFNNVWLVCAISVAIGFLLAFLYSTRFKRQ